MQGPKGRATDREKMFANHTSGKGPVLMVHRELSKHSGQSQTMQWEHRQKARAGRPRDTIRHMYMYVVALGSPWQGTLPGRGPSLR